jgi:hypothetical protein
MKYHEIYSKDATVYLVTGDDKLEDGLEEVDVGMQVAVDGIQ